MSTIHTVATIEMAQFREPVEIQRFEGKEAISELFHLQVDVTIEKESPSIRTSEWIGTSATVEIQQANEPSRYFNGIIMATECLDQTHRAKEKSWLYNVRIHIFPQLFVYSKNQDYRLFEEKTAPDILKIILEESGCQVALNLKSTYEVRGYTTQFGESNFAFISRLMEEEGIYYYFEHAKGRHTIVLCDSPGSHSAGVPATLKYNPTARKLNIGAPGNTNGDNMIHTWAQKQTAHAQREFTLWDNLFSMPGNNIAATARPLEFDNDTSKFFRKVETYDFQGTYEFHQPASGEEAAALGSKHIASAKARAAVREQILEAQRKIYTGIALTPTLACGRKFTLENPPGYGDYTQFMLLRVRTVVYGPTFASYNPDAEGPPKDAVVEIEAIPADYIWRSQRTTPRPIAHGPQTAVVVGAEGKEIYTDKYGRVKVQFHWDRKGKKDMHSSAWLRVSQTGGLGNINMPRVGHEVLVGFLDGNPDRPIVIGRLFNAENMPSYVLPEHQSRTVWRSKTLNVPDGKSAKEALPDEAKPLDDVKDTDGNELRFEDLYGKEEVLMLAHRDMNTRIRFNETHHVGRNQEVKILLDATRHVERDQTVEIKQNSKVTIGKDSTIETKGNEKRTVTGTSDVTITGNHKVLMEGEANYTTNGKNTIKVDGDDKQTYGGKSDIDVASTLTINANTKILLAVGGNSIEISQSGIKINGVMVKIEGQAAAEVSGAMTTVKASGILTAQGSLVKIN